MIKPLLALLMFSLPQAIWAQDDEFGTTVMDGILADALAECRAEVAIDPQAPVPDLIIAPPAITWLDLDGEEQSNDVVLDFNHVACSLDYSLWHGSGGSILYFIVNDAQSSAWSGGVWRVDEFFGHPLILLGRHGSACDRSGAERCVQAISTYDGEFSVVVFPGPIQPE